MNNTWSCLQTTTTTTTDNPSPSSFYVPLFSEPLKKGDKHSRPRLTMSQPSTEPAPSLKLMFRKPCRCAFSATCSITEQDKALESQHCQMRKPLFFFSPLPLFKKVNARLLACHYFQKLLLSTSTLNMFSFGLAAQCSRSTLAACSERRLPRL